MKYKITDISNGGDFEVSEEKTKRLLAACGTKKMAKGLVKRLEVADEMVDVLTDLRGDCAGALKGDWDKGDEGFKAMRSSIDGVLQKYKRSIK